LLAGFECLAAVSAATPEAALWIDLSTLAMVAVDGGVRERSEK
jgi:hypothetical protein